MITRYFGFKTYEKVIDGEVRLISNMVSNDADLMKVVNECIEHCNLRGMKQEDFYIAEYQDPSWLESQPSIPVKVKETLLTSYDN